MKKLLFLILILLTSNSFCADIADLQYITGYIKYKSSDQQYRYFSIKTEDGNEHEAAANYYTGSALREDTKYRFIVTKVRTTKNKKIFKIGSFEELDRRVDNSCSIM